MQRHNGKLKVIQCEYNLRGSYVNAMKPLHRTSKQPAAIPACASVSNKYTHALHSRTDIAAGNAVALPRNKQHDGAADEAGHVLGAQAEEGSTEGGVLHAQAVGYIVGWKMDGDGHIVLLQSGCSASGGSNRGRRIKAAGRYSHGQVLRRGGGGSCAAHFGERKERNGVVRCPNKRRSLHKFSECARACAHTKIMGVK